MLYPTRRTMMSTDVRIATLESQVRTLKRMLFGVFGVVVVGGLLAATTLQSVPDVIQAKKFEVLDQHGHSRAVLGLGPFEDVKSNQPYIAFKNKDGKALAAMGVLPGGGGLALSRSDGSNYAAIVLGDEEGVFAMTNKRGQQTVVLSDVDSSGGVLGLSRPDGSLYTGIAHTDKGSLIKISDKKGNAMAMMGMKGSQPFIGCQDAKGDIAVEITVDDSNGPNAGPSVSVFGPGGSLLKGGGIFGSNSYLNGGVMSLWNMDGRMKMIQAPPVLSAEDKALLEACHKDGVSVSKIQDLIRSGADVNCSLYNRSKLAKGIDTDMTPLMVAAENQGDPEIISALLKSGARANAKSNQGKTALTYAKGNKKLKGTKAIGELEAAMKQK